MDRAIDITPLLKAAGLEHGASVELTENMSGLEPNFRDDWLYLGILSLGRLRGDLSIKSAACIGSGNGIDAIALLQFLPQLDQLFVTDILSGVLAPIRANIETNCAGRETRVSYLCGRDCLPLPQKVDLIYANLPLIMVGDDSLSRNLATTTLTEASSYLPLSDGPEDPLLSYSLLSQLGFLVSAKEKLNPGGKIITLLGGRVPFELLRLVFSRAGLKHREVYCAFKLQSDPQFVEHYAGYEGTHNVNFTFYDYTKASNLLEQKWGIRAPDIVAPHSGTELAELLTPARLNAKQAFSLLQKGQAVGHIAFAYEAEM